MTKPSSTKPDYIYEILCDTSLGGNVKCKGVALIVCNNYEGTKNALSTDNDLQLMTAFFTTLQNYKVITHTNITSVKFLSICKDLASVQYPDVYKRIVIYFSGHGGDGSIKMTDRKAIRIDEIQSIFDPIKRPNLKNIARIYFFDTCRGAATYFGDAMRSGDYDNVTDCSEPRAKHGKELVAYSTLKGHVAYNDKDGSGGSWTNALYVCLVWQPYMSSKHLIDVLTYANQKLESRQTSSFTTTLKEFIYFWIEAGIVPSDSVAADTGGYQDTDPASVTVTATAPLGGGQEGESFTTQSPPEPQTSPPSEPVPVLLSGNQPSHSTQAEDRQLEDQMMPSSKEPPSEVQPVEDLSSEESGDEVHLKSKYYEDNNTCEADGKLESTLFPVQQSGEEDGLLVAQKSASASDVIPATKQQPAPKASQEKEISIGEQALMQGTHVQIQDFVSLYDTLQQGAVAKWKDLGSQLGLQEDDLDAISAGQKYNDKEKMSEVFEIWKQQSLKQSWNDLIVAVANTGCNPQLCQDLKERHRQNLMDTVEMKDLSNEVLLPMAPHWYDFGLSLGINEQELVTPNYNKKFFREMLQTWWQQNIARNRTWNVVVSAVDKARLHRLANSVYQSKLQ